MKIVSWNCQGAGNESFRRNFRELVRSHNPSVVFLLETRVSQDTAYEIAPFLGYSNYEIAPTEGMAGGVWMLWNQSDIDVEITEVEDQGIHAILRPRRQDPWMVSGIYAKPYHQDKVRIFNSLENISKTRNLPWLVTGDFNEIGFSHEKQGGKVVSVSRLLFFQRCMAACNLQDLGFHGPNFTWTIKRENGRIIRERIDRAMANEEWIQRFPDNAVLHLPRTHSDHHPILKNCYGMDVPAGNRPFRFEAM